MMRRFILSSVLISSSLPLIALAASTAPTDFKGFIGLFIDLISAVLPVLAGLSLLVFFRGLALFIWNSGDSGSHEEGKNIMIWGLIGLFVMLSVWGILRFAYSDFGFGSTRKFGIPVLSR